LLLVATNINYREQKEGGREEWKSESYLWNRNPGPAGVLLAAAAI